MMIDTEKYIKEGWMSMSNSYYHTAGVRKTCHDVKQNKNPILRNNAIKRIAEDLISRDVVQFGDVLIPAPQHNGDAEYTKDIARIISKKTGAVVADILKCIPHSSLYEQKKEGRKTELSLYLDGEIPLNKNLYFIDNVISSGMTFRLANELFSFRLQPLVYAVDETKSPDLGKNYKGFFDDAQGYGYKTAQKAYAGYSYKNRDKSKDNERIAKKKHIKNWMKQHKSFVKLMDDYAFEIAKGAMAPDDKFDAKFVKKLLKSEGLEPDFTANDLLKVWRDYNNDTF